MQKEFELILGSAFWGWNQSKATAFSILENAIAKGIRFIDAATNYPMNALPNDFRLGEQILAEFIKAHGIQDLKIIMKLGSVTNARSADCNLSKSFLLMMSEEYQRLFDTNLHCIMFHWDARSDKSAIQDSLEALELIQGKYDVQPGLSGISHPEIYADTLLGQNLNFFIEGKHNVFHSDIPRYDILNNPANRFFVYGINAGGIKLHESYSDNSTIFARGGNPEIYKEKLIKIQNQIVKWNAEVRPPIKKMNQLGLIHAYNHSAINGVIIGPSSVQQLNESIDFSRNLGVFDFSDISVFINSKVN